MSKIYLLITGAGVFAGFAFEGEAVVFVTYHYANLISVFPREGGGTGAGIVDEGLCGGFCQTDVDGYSFCDRDCGFRSGGSFRDALSRASGKCNGEEGIDCFFHNAAVLEDPVAPRLSIAFEDIRYRVVTCDRTDKDGLFCADLNHCGFGTEILFFHWMSNFTVQNYGEEMVGHLPFLRKNLPSAKMVSG
jgi:hypothetical protein